MGLLSGGTPLTWEETKNLSKHVRDHGIEQFINLYCRLKDRTTDVLEWGDEVLSEYEMLLLMNNLFRMNATNSISNKLVLSTH